MNKTILISMVCMLSLGAVVTACSQAPSTVVLEVSETVSSKTVIAVTKWEAAHVDAKGAFSLLSAKPETVVIDVRTPKELAGGHIEGAVFANFFEDDFRGQLSKLDRETPYIVHCKGGGRSTKALTTLKELGFNNVTHMDGGLDSWKRAKLPLAMP